MTTGAERTRDALVIADKDAARHLTRAMELDPADAFQFDLDRYKQQLIAGYSRTLQSDGLEVWMRDIGKLHRK